MTNEEVNRTIHEARGLCWHEDDGLTARLVCKKCKLTTLSPDCFINPPYTYNWKDYGEALEWAQEQEWWEEFITYLIRKVSLEYTHGGQGKSIYPYLLNPLRGSHALVEFIEANPELIKEGK